MWKYRKEGNRSDRLGKVNEIGQPQIYYLRLEECHEIEFRRLFDEKEAFDNRTEESMQRINKNWKWKKVIKQNKVKIKTKVKQGDLCGVGSLIDGAKGKDKEGNDELKGQINTLSINTLVTKKRRNHKIRDVEDGDKKIRKEKS